MPARELWVPLRSSLSCRVDCPGEDGRVTCDCDHPKGQCGARDWSSIHLAALGEDSGDRNNRCGFGAEPARAESSEACAGGVCGLQLVLAPSSLRTDEECCGFGRRVECWRRLGVSVENDLRAGAR